MELRVKQAIVIRKDLGMRRGKEIAQGAHASLAFLVRRVLDAEAAPAFTPEESAWMRGGSAKICLQVASEAELLDVCERAGRAGLETHLIRDSGKTEFGGVPTYTCLAIGPDTAEHIDPVTRDLKLY